jgi:hypothetical protein
MRTPDSIVGGSLILSAYCLLQNTFILSSSPPAFADKDWLSIFDENFWQQRAAVVR